MASHSIEDLTPRGPRRGDLGETAFRRRASAPPGPRELPPLRARGVGEILDTALDVLRGRFLTCMLVALPLWLPVNAVSRFSFRFDEETQLVVALLVIVPAAAMVQMMAGALITIVVYGYMQGHRVGARKALLVGVKRAPALILTSIVSGVGISVGMACFCLPGLVLSWLWMVAPAALVLERLGPLEALGRSARLVQRSFLRWLGLAVVQWWIALPFLIATSVLGNADWRGGVRETLQMPPVLFDALDVLLVSLISSVATALAAVILTVFYLDARVRNEGFDLRMRFERLRERAPSERAAGGVA